MCLTGRFLGVLRGRPLTSSSRPASWFAEVTRLTPATTLSALLLAGLESPWAAAPDAAQQACTMQHKTPLPVMSAVGNLQSTSTQFSQHAYVLQMARQAAITTCPSPAGSWPAWRQKRPLILSSMAAALDVAGQGCRKGSLSSNAARCGRYSRLGVGLCRELRLLKHLRSALPLSRTLHSPATGLRATLPPRKKLRNAAVQPAPFLEINIMQYSSPPSRCWAVDVFSNTVPACGIDRRISRGAHRATHPCLCVP